MPRQQINTDQLFMVRPSTGLPGHAEEPERTKTTALSVHSEPYDGGELPGDLWWVEKSPVVELEWAPSAEHKTPNGDFRSGGYAVLVMSIDSEQILRMAREILASAEHGDEHRPKTMGAYTAPLSRAELQMLVRCGRRARDAVFGGDE